MRASLPTNVRALFNRRGVESDRVEYKARWTKEIGDAALRTMCAFANDLFNHNGGYLVFGVKEEGGAPVLPPEGLAEHEVESIQKAVSGLANNIQPSWQPIVTTEQVYGRWLVIARCPAGDGRPYDAPDQCSVKGSRRAYWVRVGPETKEAKGHLLNQLREVSTHVPFDDRTCLDATTADLSPALVLHHLREAGSSLADEGSSAEVLYRKLALVRPVNGHEALRNVALLFFSERPRARFRGAVIEITFRSAGDDTFTEHVVEGPLPSMLRNALDVLRALPHRDVKRADRAETDRVYAYPFAALDEALTNAVHHRGYDVPDPIKVDVFPDRVRITSYPGPVPGISRASLEGEDTPAVPARNRRIAELLKEVRLAEARQSGIGKIRREMAKNGSPPPVFRFDEERTYLEVTLPVHPAFLAVSRVPLRLGRPARADEAVGRAALCDSILAALETRHVLLTGARGVGVSTVMEVVAAALEARGRAVVRVDLQGVSHHGLMETLASVVDAPGDASKHDVLRALGERVLVLDHGAGAGDWSQGSADVVTDLMNAVAAFPQVRVMVGGDCEWPDDLLGRFRLFSVPPLGQASAKALVASWLGSVAEEDLAVAEDVAILSGGIPGIMGPIVERLSLVRVRTPDDAIAAFDQLAVEPGDPTGIVALEEQFRSAMTLPAYPTAGRLSGAPGALVALLAASPLRRLDLVARAVTDGGPDRGSRLAVLSALRGLELAGWVVEVDGVVRLLHPWLADVWRSLPTSAPPATDDIPF